MAAGVDKDQEVAAGIDVKEAAAAAEEGEAAGMTNSILDVDAQQDSPHMYNLAAPTPVSPLTRAASLTRPAIVTSTRSCSPHACSQHPSQNRFLAEPLVRKPIHAGGRRRCDLAPDHGRRFQPS
ncbi:hypothetical protein A0H81_03515 [Grifola frondosa]|uniref:Uncharacterized protein n=1 Tax=Grifola frondosa TaxID=5627 RepID=A0A1C7MI34_GRIFR|nr:hypothetical protein A0H81_03515 [Grifola frondosa]